MLRPNSLDYGARVHYPNLAEFLADACAVHSVRRQKSSHDTLSANWYGTANFESAVALAHKGWNHGAKMAADMTSELVSSIMGKLTDNSMYLDTTTNYCWDMASAVAGVPQCGINFAPDTDKKLVRIVVDCNASGGIDSSVLLRKAASVAALVYALEYANFDTEIIVAEHLGNRGRAGESIQCAITVKQAGCTIDLAAVAYALGHPSFYRRLFFNWMEQYYCEARFIEWIKTAGYGNIIPLVDLSGDITIPYMMFGEDQWKNATTAETWILSQLKKQGVQFA